MASLPMVEFKLFGRAAFLATLAFEEGRSPSSYPALLILSLFVRVFVAHGFILLCRSPVQDVDTKRALPVKGAL